jgi:ABC-type lipoprotein release transport system permease subunit
LTALTRAGRRHRRRLADQLSLHAGDSITLVAPKGAVTPMGTTPRIKPYKVAAVFEVGMSEYDGIFVFMPLPEAQAYSTARTTSPRSRCSPPIPTRSTPSARP